MVDKLKILTRQSVLILYLAAVPLFVEQGYTQEIFLHDTTLNTETTYMSTSVITIGPNLTVDNHGIITLRARERIAIMPGVYIRGGGTIHALTGLVAHIEPEQELILPSDFTVYENYPNPFNPSTTIRYILPEAEEVKAVIYTIYGEKVITLFEGKQNGGAHRLVWDGTNQSGRKMSSGIYYLHISAGENQAVIKMTLLK
jgi:hypothetical protein